MKAINIKTNVNGVTKKIKYAVDVSADPYDVYDYEAYTKHKKFLKLGTTKKDESKQFVFIPQGEEEEKLEEVEPEEEESEEVEPETKAEELEEVEPEEEKSNVKSNQLESFHLERALENSKTNI